jgi:hypothetical protein
MAGAPELPARVLSRPRRSMDCTAAGAFARLGYSTPDRAAADAAAFLALQYPVFEAYEHRGGGVAAAAAGDMQVCPPRAAVSSFTL